MNPFQQPMNIQPPAGAAPPPEPSALGRLVGAVFEPVEYVFGALGLVSPVSRALFGLAAGALVVFAVKPQSAWKADGTPKQLIWLLPADKRKEGTYFPWYFWALVPAILFGFFI